MYTIEKVIRNFNEGEREVKFLAGVGNLTNDVEARKVTLKSGDKIFVAGGFSQSIAFDYWENGKKKPVFFQIEAWGKTAEILGKIGKKGRELVTLGRLENRQSKNKDGKIFNNEVLVVERVQVTSRGWEVEEKKETSMEAVNVEGFESTTEDIPF